MKKINITILLIGIVSILTACGYNGAVEREDSRKEAINDVQGEGKQLESLDNRIMIRNFAFNPNSLTVKKGATVTWTNLDQAAHQIKSDKVNSPLLQSGESYSYTFNETGTYDYICGPHPRMTATIVVQ
jgi:plastocyanin